MQKIRRVLAHRQLGLTVVMENIHDPHNVSAVLRTCDAVGVSQVELLYTVEKFPRIGRKSSSSANKWIERRKHTTVSGCYATLRREGFRILATRMEDSSPSLYDLDLTDKVALVFGNEHRGVSAEAARNADGVFQRPMFGMIQSLNVSVAAAVCLYEALRQRLARSGSEIPRLAGPDLEQRVEDWARR